jgi:hypothetical protein
MVILMLYSPCPSFPRLLAFIQGTGNREQGTKHDLEGYAIAATKNQVFEAILIMMLRSLQAISRAFFMINLPSREQKEELRLKASKTIYFWLLQEVS